MLDRHQGGVKSTIAFPGSLKDLHEDSVDDYVQVLEVIDQNRILLATRKGFVNVLHLPQLQWEILYYQEGSTFRFMCTNPASSTFQNHVLLGEDAGFLTLKDISNVESKVSIIFVQ